MRVIDLNQDVLKLKKILHKYEEKFGKLERKKHNNNEENCENGGTVSRSPHTEEESEQKTDKTGN